ncbi:hypothetical protein GO730_06795 [Spirosoma sp. HMF3257]|nr:hypothetical protein [Spirosoma telluris]
MAEQTYFNNLSYIINKSRQQLTHNRLAWLVSRASYISGATNSHVIDAQNRLSREISDVYVGPATDGLIGPDNRVDDIHFGGQGLIRVANLWNQSLTDQFFSQSSPFTPTADINRTDGGWQPVMTGIPSSSLQRVGYRYESASHSFFLLVGTTAPVEGRMERLDSGDFSDTSWATLSPTATSSYNNPGFSDFASLRFYPSSISPGRYRLSVRRVGDTGPGYQLETVLRDFRNTLFIGNEPVIQKVGPASGPDLALNLDLPQANFATTGSVGNFVVNVFEVAGLPTSSGNVQITITAPLATASLLPPVCSVSMYRAGCITR